MADRRAGGVEPVCRSLVGVEGLSAATAWVEISMTPDWPQVKSNRPAQNSLIHIDMQPGLYLMASKQHVAARGQIRKSRASKSKGAKAV